MSPKRLLARIADDPRHLYMATAEAGILETTDGGRRWTPVLTP